MLVHFLLRVIDLRVENKARKRCRNIPATIYFFPEHEYNMALVSSLISKIYTDREKRVSFLLTWGIVESYSSKVMGAVEQDFSIHLYRFSHRALYLPLQMSYQARNRNKLEEDSKDIIEKSGTMILESHVKFTIPKKSWFASWNHNFFHFFFTF